MKKIKQLIALLVCMAMAMAVLPAMTVGAEEPSEEFDEVFKYYGVQATYSPTHLFEKSYTGNLRIEFDLVVNAFSDGVIAFSSSYGVFGPEAIAIHTLNGFVARNGDGSGNATQESFYTPELGETYHFSITTNTTQHVWSGEMTTPDGETVTVADNYGYRTDQDSIDRIIMLRNTSVKGYVDDVELSNLKIYGSSGERKCGDNLTWALDDDGTLTISGTGDMWNWSDSTSNLAPWKDNYNSSIKAVNIEDGVTKIGQYAFYYCPRIVSVTIPDSVKSIDGYSLSYCQSLTSVTIPSSVTYIGWGAFASSAITDIYYNGTEEDWNNIYISEGNSYLSSITIHYLGSGTEIVDSGTCGDDLTWTLDSDGTLTVSGTGDMWNWSDSTSNLAPWKDNYNSSIKTVKIEDGVTKIGQYAFYYCPNIVSVTIPNSVKSIDGYSLSYCPSLTSVAIPSSVTYIGWGAFVNSAITDIYYGGSEEDWNNITINQGNDYLSSITIHYLGTDSVSVTSIALDKASATLTVGESTTLAATVLPEDAANKAVTWVSSDTSVATVSGGVVTAKAAGKSTIYAITSDGGYIASCAVTVNNPIVSVTGVSLSKTSATLTVGESVSLSATVSPSDATNTAVTWTSSNTSVATVSGGTVTAKGAGTATITATTSDGGYTASCTVTVKAATVSVTGVSLNKTSASLTVGDTTTLTATVAPTNATNTAVTWKSSNTSVATVSGGTVTAKGAGTATITVTTSDGGYTASCTVTVKAATVSVTGVSLNKASETLTVGDTTTLTATVAPTNATNTAVTWKSSNTSVATVSDGTITAKGAGTATITVTTSDGGYTASCAVTVNSPAPKYTADITVGNVSGHAGEEVSVPVSIANNPGIAGFNLTINYDKTKLIPVSVNIGSILTGSITSNIQQGGDMTEYDFVTAYWDNPSDITSDGELFNVTFKIAEDVEEGEIPVTVTYENGDTSNQNYEDVELNITNGSVTVNSIIIGDVFQDGVVNTKDGVRLRQYLAKWDIDLTSAELAAADVLSDGAVDTKDGVRLRQYLANWDIELEEARTASLMESSTDYAGTIAFEVGSVEVKEGEYIDVPVYITENSGVAGFNMQLNYDKTKLTPVSISLGSAWEGYITSNIQQGGDMTRFDFVTAYWDNPSNVTSTGEAFVVRFSAADGVYGEIPVWLSYDENDVPCNQNYEELEVEITNGTVTVTDPSKCGDNLKWSLDNGVLTISGTGDMWDYDYYTDFPWYDSLESITSVVVKDGVDDISNCTFSACPNLTSVSIPSMWSYYPGDIYDDIYFLLDGCDALESIEVEDYDDGNYYCFKSIDGVLYYVNRELKWGTATTILAIVKYPVNKPDTVYRITGDIVYIYDNAFDGCKNLAEFYVVKNHDYFSAEDGVLFDKYGTELIKYPPKKEGATYNIPEDVTTVYRNAFENSSLESINIPKYTEDISGYCSSDAFYNCHALKEINVDEANETFSSIDGVLFNKDKTELKAYPVGKTGAYKIPSGVTYIYPGAFQGCAGLTSVFVPNGIDVIEDWAFLGCTSLTDVYLPYGIYDIYDYAFEGTAVTDIYYGGSEEDWQEVNISEDGNDALLNANVHYNCTDFAEITYAEAEVIDGEVIVYTETVSIGDAIPFVAGYSEDGDVIFTGKTDEDGCAYLPAETKSVKVFVWESLESMIPLCEAKTVTVQQ